MRDTTLSRAGVSRQIGYTLNSFNDFGLAEPILRALSQEQYTTPTPIQSDAIPVVLAGRDLVGIAQTGTGKTAAFALPILNRLHANRKPLEKKSPRVLVLSPTRELSSQILESFRTYGRHMRIQSALVIGGVPMGRQVRDLMNGLDVLVATPGRLLDLLRSNAVRLNQVEVLVLDEADRMLDMGFIHDIRTIVAKLSKERQTLLFSATMPREIADLAAHMLRDPARVAVTPVASTVERVVQRVIMTDKPAKSALLIEVLRDEVTGQTLVFTRTKHGADKVVKSLHHAGLSAEAIHGNKSQNQRERVLGSFRSGKLRTLVATDIAARGIDVEGISHVINYDLPNIPGELRAPHRPHRARRRRRRRDLVLRQRRAGVPARHREADPDQARRHRPPFESARRRAGPPPSITGRSRIPAAMGATDTMDSAATGNRSVTASPPGTASLRRHEQPRQADHGHRAPATPSTPDNIATVGFMRRHEPRRGHMAGDANRNTR